MKAHKLYEDGVSSYARGDSVDCIQKLSASLFINPNNSDAWALRAAMLLKHGHPFDAVMNFDKAIELKPNVAELHLNKGTAYSEAGEYGKAFECYDKATELNPDFDLPYMNKANILRVEKGLKAAVEFYRKGIECNPDNADCHFGLSLSLLELGQYEEGWKEYDWRWKTGQTPSRGLKVPEWNGEPAESSTDVLLFYAEQGFGDILQFIRYAPLLKEKWGGKVFVEVRWPMLRLARTVKGIDGVIAFGEQIPINMKKALPMMNAPKIMGTTVETIPCNGPYIHPGQSRINIWNEQLKKLGPGPKIGICWAGGARPHQPIASAVDKKRSTILDEFKPLCLPGLKFVSLQIGPDASQVHSCPAGMTIGDWSDEIDDYYDTAALIECLDLVISVDTSVVHIAGALGKPVWLLSRFDNCWRWLGNRQDSPWYPSLRQFIQPSSGDWFGLMQNVKRELQQFYLSQRKVA